MTRRSVITIVVLAVFVIANSTGIGQERKDPSRHRLLWRITAPGIPGASYLFGTMHVRDERAFAFGDSVLPALRRCEAFAMEVDMDSVISAMVGGRFTTTNTAIDLQNLLYPKFGLSRRRRSIDTILDGITIGRKPVPFHRDDYPIFLDLYLKQLAKAGGKTCHVVEDLAVIRDYLSVISAEARRDTVFTPRSRKEILEGQRSQLTLYEQGDIDGIYVHATLLSSTRLTNAIIHHRNKGMVDRIAELVRVRATFIAVGVGHLPGEQGLIELLREKGYTVEPVIQTFGDPLPSRDLPSVPYEAHAFRTVDSVLSFDSPIPLESPTSSINATILTRLHMGGEQYMGVDAAGGVAMTVVHMTDMEDHLSREPETLDDAVAKVSAYVDSVTSTEEKVIAGRNVFVIHAIRQKIHITQMIVKTESTVSVITLTQRDMDGSLQSNIERSLTIAEPRHVTESKEEGGGTWKVYTNDTLGFSIDMPEDAFTPAKPILEPNLRMVWGRGYWDGNNRPARLLVQVADLRPGGSWMTEGFRNLPMDMAETMDLEITDTIYGERQGYPYCRATFKNGEGTWVFGYIVRDDRLYMLAGIWETEREKAMVERFHASFGILPFEQMRAWSTVACLDSTLTIPLPRHASSGPATEYDETIACITGRYHQDTVSNVTWFVGKALPSEYRMIGGSTDEIMNVLIIQGGLIDSMTLVDTTILIGSIHVREVHRLLKRGPGVFIQRSFFCGEELYVLSTRITVPTYHDRRLWSAPFDQLTCRCPGAPDERSLPSADRLLDDIVSEDDIRKDRAYASLWLTTITPSDYDVYATRYEVWVRDEADIYAEPKELLLRKLFRHDAARTRRFLLALADSTKDERIRTIAYHDAVSYRDVASIRLLDSLLEAGNVPDTIWSQGLFARLLLDTLLSDPFTEVVERHYLRPNFRDTYLMMKGFQYEKDSLVGRDTACIGKVEYILKAVTKEMGMSASTVSRQERYRQYGTLRDCLSLLWYYRHEKKAMRLMRSLAIHRDQDVGLEAVRNLVAAGERPDTRSIRRFFGDASKRMALLRLCDSSDYISMIPKPVLVDTSLLEALIVEEVQRVSQDPYDDDTFEETVPFFGEKGYRQPSSIVVKDYQEENPAYQGRWILVKFRTNQQYGPDVWYAGMAGPFFSDMRGHIGKLAFVTKYDAFDDYDADEHARLLMEWKVEQDSYEEAYDE